MIAWAVETFGDSLVLAASFEDVVLIDLATKVAPGIEVVFLDTEAHFPETLAFVEEIRARYDLNLTVTKPGPEAAAYPCGTDQCCQFRKVAPLRQALAGQAGLADRAQAGRRPHPGRRAHRRAGTRHSGWSRSIPLATWTDEDIAVVLRRPRSARAPPHAPGLPLHRLRPDDAPGGRGRGPPGRPLGRSRTSPSAACTSSRLCHATWTTPTGWSSAVDATAGCSFVRPYRNIGELNPIEQLKLARHPFEVAQAVIDTYSKQGPAPSSQVPGRGGAAQVGRACIRSARAAMPS